MSMIKCSENCIHQFDGWCTLEGAKKVLSPLSDCCFFDSSEKISPNPVNDSD
ncbi:MAG: hydroxymyristoyl-ACP dehydratase [Oscillospiraceae bacterium]|nr:hydroxymyristoyl-ACP dehydratase [Oscillospiraceae bacterium]